MAFFGGILPSKKKTPFSKNRYKTTHYKTASETKMEDDKLVLIPLYIRGMVIPVSKGTTMLFAPADMPEEEAVTVTVQGISFIIARGMVVKEKEEDASNAHPTTIPLKDNFFALALRNGEKTIDIHSGHDDILHQAKYYPVVFNYLLRRSVGRRYEPIADYHMEPEDAKELHELLNVLFVIEEQNKLPTSADGLKVRIAIIPEITHNSRHDIDTEMCVDPTFVRLVQEVTDPNMSKSKEAKTRRKDTLRALCDKHYVERMPMETVKQCTIQSINRGTRFAVEIDEDEELLGLPQRDFVVVVEERSDYYSA
jgi:hypothetical protein